MALDYYKDRNPHWIGAVRYAGNPIIPIPIAVISSTRFIDFRIKNGNVFVRQWVYSSMPHTEAESFWSISIECFPVEHNEKLIEILYDWSAKYPVEINQR